MPNQILTILAIIQLEYRLVSQMISASLQFHTPQSIYHFLSESFEQFSLVTRSNTVDINFEQDVDIERLINTTVILEGMPLEFFYPKHNNVAKQPLIQIQQKQETNEKMIDEKQKDPNQQPIDIIINKAKFGLAKTILEYQNLVLSAEQKVKQINNSEIDEKEITVLHDQFQSFLTYKLEELSFELQNNFRKLTSNIRNYQTQQKINVQQDIESVYLPPRCINKGSKYTQKIQFINQDRKLSLKRIVPLNQNQLFCTSFATLPNLRGLFKVYNIDNQSQVNSIQSETYPFGVLSLDKHLVVGDTNGQLYLLRSKNLNMISKCNAHNDSTIYDIIKSNYKTNDLEPTFLTIGLDETIKIYKINQQMSKINILADFNLGNNIFGFDLIKQDSEIVIGSRQKIFNFDINIGKILADYRIQNVVRKVKRIQQNLIAIANGQNLTYMDLRSHSIARNFKSAGLLKAICPLNTNATFYGTNDGEVGVADIRMNVNYVWNNRISHKHKIADITLFSNIVVSADVSGQIVSWSPTKQF